MTGLIHITDIDTLIRNDGYLCDTTVPDHIQVQSMLK